MLTDRSRIARPFARRALCSSLAIATALLVGAGTARAQTAPSGSFQGNGTFSVGSGTITVGTGTTTIDITSSDAVINWTTFDSAIGGGPIIFQPSGTTATFQRVLQDFSVLNRIMPTDPSRAVQFNGTVISQIQSSVPPTPGGSVYFYSPGGVIVGSTAVFNVGNLGLTSIAPAVVAGVFEQAGTNGKFVQLNGAVTPGSAVTIQPGAQITANGYYVAIVAPVISQRGTISANVGTALVSADAATMTFNVNGLIDIQVTSGTSGNLGGFNSTLFNDGTITGPAYSGTGALHRVYMVAVPKNTAITLAINGGSSLGFAIAGAADVNGNAVVLSAGRDIVGGNIASGPSAGGGTGAADLNIAGSTITSALIGASTRDTSLFSTLAAPAAPTTHAFSTVSLQGDTSADIAADGTGTTVTIDRAVTLTADRTGGTATGGTTQIFAINGGNVTLGNGATLTARGFGNAGGGVGVAGQNGTGGTNIIQALSGGDIAITGGVTMFALGQGGNASAAAAGNGLGGRSQIFARDSGSSVSITGFANVFANGQGGVSTNGTGGTGTGGQALVNAQVAASDGITIGGATTLQAIGKGGNATGGPAGAGFGGNAVAAASVNNRVQFGSTLNVFGLGIGGDAVGGAAGSATGGTARIVLFSNGTMSIGGNTQVISNGFTGSGNPNSALAQGGTTSIEAQNNSTLTITGGLLAASGGIGSGASPSVGTGSGRGGSTTVFAATGGSIGVTTTLFARSLGIGADGGNGTGGTVNVQLNGGTLSGGSLSVDAQGTGGNIGAAGSGNAGIGTGGSASINVGAGTNTLTFNLISVDASGQGGNNSGSAGNGGAGVGGISQINVTGGASLTVNAADTDVDAFGVGGNSNSLTGDGGAGNAGRAIFSVDGGTAIFNGNVSAYARSIGGAGINGGTAFGDPESNLSRAFVFARNGSLTVTGLTALRATADGGTGNLAGNGGNATGGLANVLAVNGVNTTGFGIITLRDLDIDSGARGGTATGTGNGGTAGAGRAEVFVNGGTITIGGDANLYGDAFGGDGVNGGNAISARSFRRAFIGTNNGTISVAGSTFLSATAFGGDGNLGGAGGIAFAGQADIDTPANNGPGAINLADLSLDVSAFGGDGGSAVPGQGGGAGGEAYSGNAAALGVAGRGVLTITGNTTIAATAFGGTGGQGHTGGTTAPGTPGGVGGRAFGGAITVGTRSGLDTPSNAGSASFKLVTGDASAVGGDGGNGGTGTTAGAGGKGGTGFGGSAGILVRGSPATFTDVVLTADGTGGNGGSGSIVGNGGDGYAGDGHTTVTQRFNRTERGSLMANNVAISARGVGGTGGTVGKSFYAAAQGTESEFFIRQSDVSIGNYSLTTSGNLAPNVTATILQVVDPMVSGIPVPTSVTVTAEPYDLTMLDSTVTITNGFTLTTPGQMRLTLDNSTLNSANLTLSAANFVLPATPPAVYGTINVSSGLNLSSSLDFLAYANFNVGSGGGIYAFGGSFLTGGLTSNGPLDITAGGSITTGVIQASDVTLTAGAAIATGAINSNGNIDLVAVGAATTGQLTASDTATVSAGGAVNVAGASAGIVNPSTNPFAEYTVGLRSLVSVTAGDLSSRANIGLSSPGAISVGNLSTGAIVLALAGTGLTTGSITASAPTGRVYLANFSMEALGGQITGNFNPAPILAAMPVAINGPIAINGAVTTGTLQANTLQSLSISGSTLARQVSALVAGTTLTTGNVTVGDRAVFAAGGAIMLGNVDAGITLNTGGLQKIAIGSSNGPVNTGTLSARQDLGIQSGGAITTGNLRGRDVLLLAGGSVTTGGIAAVNGTQPVGRVYIGNFSMANQTSNVFLPFSGPLGSLPIFNLQPVRIGGALTFNGGVSAGSLFGAAAQGISLQSVTTPAATTQIGSGGVIDLDSGGLVTVNGRLAAGHRIDIVSRDIDITQTGSLDALGPDGEILLASDNPNGMFVGDGLTATSGYMLSNAEYGRLKAGEIDVVGADIINLANDLTIGNLTINAAQLYGANGTALFASGNRETQTPGGILRIAGAVVASGFTATNEIDLLSGTVELEAEKGSLKIDNGSGGLGGQIVFQADHVHVASDAILAKLRADPLYEGHVKEINAPALVQRTDGVLNASNLDFSSRSQTVYIQNTGSIAVPAGIVTRIDSSSNTGNNNNMGSEGTRPPGGSEFVINGQIQTDTGIVNGKAAFDLVIASLRAEAVADGKTFASDLTPTSTFNGCVITTGVCAFGNTDPVAALSSEISVVTSAALDESPVAPTADDSDEGDEAGDEKKDEDDSSDEGSSPITPPTPLISTRALDGNVNVVEPVSGAGNPALFGSAVDETTVQGEKP